MEIKNKKIAFIFTDCYFNFEILLKQLKKLKKSGASIFPILDDFTFSFENDIKKICNRKILHTSEITNNDKSFDIMIIAPANENTISKLACDIIDNPILLTVKSHLRNNLPIIIAPSSLDGLRSKFKAYCRIN